MIRRVIRVVCVVLPSLMHGSNACSTAEPWADPGLVNREGLVLWLDAGRAGGDKPAREGALASWADASGNHRSLEQGEARSRPTLLSAGDLAVVRFDGVHDFLTLGGIARSLEGFHLFAFVIPRSNPGDFSGLLAFNAEGERDYTSGLNVDLGPASTSRLGTVNVEGRGFGGARNLRTAIDDFASPRLIELLSEAPGKPVRLRMDGRTEGERPRGEGEIRVDRITVGARHFSNDAGPNRAQSFGRFDVAELVVYDRALDDAAAKSVREYIEKKYASMRKGPPSDPSAGEPLIAVADPPPIQVFAPGFRVRQLPLDLTNINNVRCRPDGSAYALGYDGRIWLLRDRDGDGLEDDARLFWDNRNGLRAPIGMDLTPPGYPKGEGVFIATKTKVALIVDTDHDGTADREIEVAGGWRVNAVAVDALGVAYDHRDRSIYYGRGSFSYTDPLQRDANGVSHFSLTDGTSAILRVSPDFSSKEIVATGIRFPVGLAFNSAGDLFATDQEGATWVPNGNPFDELLHIRPGRHYGFPSRHPKHLPGVIDEPSTFDFAPQHQSTCGLAFNESVGRNGRTFGPAAWKGDALVTGYSRGKLYRTELVKTEAGYVARNRIAACAEMLLIDACVRPDGALLVSCHSGGPDWGTGPTGKGKLFVIDYVDRSHPQPVFAWANGPRELRIEFDRPVDPAMLRDVAGTTRAERGASVSAGDRFESLRPGYAVVKMQLNEPRHRLPIRSAQLTPDRRTLVFAVDPMVEPVSYAIELPGMGRPPLSPTEPGVAPQHPAIDLGFDLTGCKATWIPDNAGPEWRGWLPHLDLAVSRRLTAGSASHDALWAAMAQPGRLRLETRLDLVDMLRPAVQPGSRLDFGYPDESVTVTLDSDSVISASVKDDIHGSLEIERPSDRRTFIRFGSKQKKPTIILELACRTAIPSLTATWTTQEDDRARPFPLRRLIVPWAGERGVPARPAPGFATIPDEWKGGSWARGRRLFRSEETRCIQCHVVEGEGGRIGPDLSNLVHRDFDSVYRDVTRPSFAINPDHLTTTVELLDGRVLSGVMRAAGDRVELGDAEGNVTTFARSEIAATKPSPVSTMPEGLLEKLGRERSRDLLTYLLTHAPSMPRDGRGARPRPRTAAEVEAALAGAEPMVRPLKPLRILLVAGPKDHGPGEHDYPAWSKAWSELLGSAEAVEVETAWEFPDASVLARADVVVFFQRGTWNAERARAIDAFQERGGGLVYIHWAVDGGELPLEFAKRIGLAGKTTIRFRHGPLELKIRRENPHPVMRNLDRLELIDESYWGLFGELPADRVLADSVEDGASRPQIWSIERGRGRVFVSIPGHYSWSFDDPLFRLILLRAIAWTAHEPVDRLRDLVRPGAEIVR